METTQAASELRTCSLKSYANIKSNCSCKSFVRAGPTDAAIILMHSKIALSETAPFFLKKKKKVCNHIARVYRTQRTNPLCARHSLTWPMMSTMKCLISLVTERAMVPIASNAVGAESKKRLPESKRDMRTGLFLGGFLQL